MRRAYRSALDSAAVPAPPHSETDAAVAERERARLLAPLPSPPTEGPWAERTTFLIKTFERPCCAVRLIRSIRARFPTVRVLVCDDSRVPLFEDGAEPLPGVRWLVLPFEAGHTLGAGRNHLLDRTDTEYFFLFDDDHTVTEGTHIGAMVGFLDRSGYDLVGGAQGAWAYGAAVFDRQGDRAYQRFGKHRGLIEPGVVACDRTSNTFLARTDAVQRVRWEERVYAGEHADFFWRATEEGLRIAQMGGTWVGHDRSCEPARDLVGAVFGRLLAHRDATYRWFRLGGDQAEGDAADQAVEGHRRYVLEKNGLAAIVDVSRPWDEVALQRLIGRPSGPLRARA